MPTYDVTFKVECEWRQIVEALDEDDALERVADEATEHMRSHPSVQKLRLERYSSDLARKDDDA